tara:strand:+ start:7938 stop:10364 length:2427 start_codon:yes stop_codon:yes gene_type:complete
MGGIAWKCEYVSLNGWKYKLTIWNKNQLTSPETAFNIGPKGAVIKYDSTGDNKFNELMCSSMTFDFVVKSQLERAWIYQYIRANTANEKDIYCALEKWDGTSWSLAWSGYMILDLDTKHDESYPYTLTFKCVDGLALLKEIPFVKNALSADDGPFERVETYAGPNNSLPYAQKWTDGWITTVSNNKYKQVAKILCEIANYAGFSGTTSDYYNTLPDPRVSISANWWNAKHTLAQIAANDPLWLTRINLEQFYKQVDASSSSSSAILYDALSCYDALINICRCFGLRATFWNNTLYFIQANQYKIYESGTVAIPVNIPTQYYDLAGDKIGNLAESVGNTNLSRYEQSISPVNGSGGLKKLKGTTWTNYPLIKKVVTTFASISNTNLLNNFPLIYGQADNPHTYPSTSVYFGVSDNEFTLTNYDGADGLYADIHLTFTNDGSMPLQQEILWTIQAKPSLDSWTGATTVVCMGKQDTAAAGMIQKWQPTEQTFDGNYYDYSDLSFISGQMASTPGQNNYYFLNHKWVTLPPGQSTHNIVDGTYLDTNFQKIFDSDPMFIGDWDFRILCISFTGNGAHPHRGHGSTADFTNYWGCCPWANITTGQPQIGFNGNCNYVNQNSTSTPSLIGLVAGGSIGSVGAQTQLILASNDSYVEEIKPTLWGDVEVNDSPSSIQVYNGTSLTWEYTDFIGKWALGSNTGTDSLTELMCTMYLFMQSAPTYKGNYKIITSKVNANYNSSVAFPAFVNPIGLFVDEILQQKKFGVLQITISTMENEVSGKFWEVRYNPVSGFTSTTTVVDDNGGVLDDGGTSG